MIVASLLFLLGLSLSAFFSGSETGFYRVSRTRRVTCVTCVVRRACDVARATNQWCEIPFGGRISEHIFSG